MVDCGIASQNNQAIFHCDDHLFMKEQMSSWGGYPLFV